MLTLEDALETLGHRPGRRQLEHYIAQDWVRPIVRQEAWQFEEIDMARVQLVYHLQQELQLGDDATDIVLHVLDQLYGLREQARRLHRAIARQPRNVQSELEALFADADQAGDEPL